ncbi:MAG: Cof-type HAD-IIB family hydrolase [Clostridium cadaveris]|uniref:Cof-type HAD-IIB family hydrolase n=1 Tax=Clostridium cadaveris TaxID=1529 RepID=UPI001459B0AD|nr:Cof-type HAD-IIB family hydrolase [Clostridium cadaveris]MDY4950278.1 Cof-type HAD-IIB family hydrolase [Clostridium cadaveris]NME65521.1 HAD family phosphatase [Clostridium cadaveris]NWK10144.1 HAD family phosphatase [Clostridium cadaveris]
MKRLMVSDLDGTLLNEKGIVSKETAHAVKQVVKKGNIFAIATGRIYSQTEHVRDALGDEILCICSNGAVVYENGNIISKHPLSKDSVEKLLNIDLSKYSSNIALNGFTIDEWITTTFDEFMDELGKRTGTPCRVCSSEEFKGHECLKVFFSSLDHECLVELEKDLKEQFPHLEIVFSHPSCLEVNEKGISKFRALENYCKRTDIDVSDVIAFGDAFNDYEMLKNVGHPCLMGNCLPKLKEAITHGTVIDSNVNNGIAKYLTKNFI